MRVHGVIPAAGVGKRFGGEMPKQYRQLAGKALLQHSIERLLNCRQIESVYVAVSEQDAYWSKIAANFGSEVRSTYGGRERTDSVHNALGAIIDGEENDWVVVHDAVRPLVDVGLIERCIDSFEMGDAGGILATPIFETVKLAADTQAGGLSVDKTLDRSQLWAAQTPQIFRYGLLKRALRSAQGNPAITDEASAMEASGHPVRIFEGHRSNIKITVSEDLILAEQLLKQEL